MKIIKNILIISLSISTGCSTAKKASILPAQVALIPVGIVDAVIGTKMAKSANSSLQDFANTKDTQKPNVEQKAQTHTAQVNLEQTQQTKGRQGAALPSINRNVNEDSPVGIKKTDEPELAFEVDNSFDKERIAKDKGLMSRSKATVKKMKLKIRGFIKTRPLNNNYKVKVKTQLIADFDCTVKRKTSYPASCGPKPQDNREIGTNDIILTKENNWFSAFDIDSEVMVFAVKEDWVGIYDVELSNLKIEPKVESIEIIK